MKSIFLITVMIVFSGFLTAGGEIPLKQAIARAMERDGGLLNQRLEVEAAETSRVNAERMKWFTLQAGAGYRYTSDTVEITSETFPFPAGLPSGQSTILAGAPSHTFDMKLGWVQPLYSGGLLTYRARAEGFRKNSETWSARQKQLEIAGRVKVSYFSHQLLGRKIDSLKILRSSLDLHLEKIERLYKEELVRKSDLIETRSRIAEIDLNILDLQQLQQGEAIQFQRLCGIEVSEIEPNYKENAPGLPGALSDLRNHPLLKMLTEGSLRLQMQKKAVGAAYLPQVNAYAEFHYARPGMNMFKDEWTPYFAGGVNLSFQVFNWNRRARDRRLADIGLEKIRNQERDFLLESEKGLRQMYSQKETLAEKLEVLNGLVSLTEEDVRLKERLYIEKQLDHLTYLQAETNREHYRSQREELRVQQNIIHVHIQNLIGLWQEES